jgi:RHS repeat-associated protein
MIKRLLFSSASLLLALVQVLPIHAAQRVEYLHSDAIGSAVVITNEAGEVVSRTDYSAYGEVLAGSTPSGLGYAGHTSDSHSGLTYMQQRYYDPTTGQLLSVDPVSAYSSPIVAFNRYRYANSNPYRFIDPNGRYSCAGTSAQCQQIAAFRDKLDVARDGLQKGSDSRAKVERVINYIGAHNDSNGVIVASADLGPLVAGNADGKGKISLNLNYIAQNGEEYADVLGATVLAHEARHEVDAKANGRASDRSQVMRTELNAYRTGSAVASGLGMDIGLGSDQQVQDAAKASTDSWCRDIGAVGC